MVVVAATTPRLFLWTVRMSLLLWVSFGATGKKKWLWHFSIRWRKSGPRSDFRWVGFWFSGFFLHLCVVNGNLSVWDCDILPPHPLPDCCTSVKIVPEVRQTKAVGERESECLTYFDCRQSEDESGSQHQEYSGFQEEGKLVTSAQEASLLCNPNCALFAHGDPSWHFRVLWYFWFYLFEEGVFGPDGKCVSRFSSVES